MHEQFGEALDVELVFRDDAPVGGASHCGKHGGVTGIAAEDLDDHEALVRAGGSAKAIDELQSARDTSAESNAIVRAGHIVVHGLGDGDDLEAFFMQADAIAEGVIAADGNESVDAEPGEILENFGREIVFLQVEGVLQVGGNAGLADAAGIRSGGVEESAAGTGGAIDNFLREHQKIIGIVVVLFADHVDEAGPTVTEADNLIAFMKRADSYSADRGIQAGNVAAAGQDADDTLLCVEVRHDSRVVPSEK